MKHAVKITITDTQWETDSVYEVEIDDEEFDPDDRNPYSYLLAAADGDIVRPSLGLIAGEAVQQYNRWDVIGEVDGVVVCAQGPDRFCEHLEKAITNRPIGKVNIVPKAMTDTWSVCWTEGDREPVCHYPKRLAGAQPRIQDGIVAAIPLLAAAGYRVDWTLIERTPGSVLDQRAEGHLYLAVPQAVS